jgi:hypothetical protein
MSPRSYLARHQSCASLRSPLMHSGFTRSYPASIARTDGPSSTRDASPPPLPLLPRVNDVSSPPHAFVARFTCAASSSGACVLCLRPSPPPPFFFSRCCRQLEDSFDPIDYAMKCLTEMPRARGNKWDGTSAQRSPIRYTCDPIRADVMVLLFDWITAIDSDLLAVV